MATGDSQEYKQLLYVLTCGEPVPMSYVVETLQHILVRLGPPEPDAEQALAEAAEAFYGSHKRT